jgi:hypothetical protein
MHKKTSMREEVIECERNSSKRRTMIKNHMKINCNYYKELELKEKEV